MDTRIAFFDIDGTLLNFGEAAVRPRVVRALEKLRASGVRLFICTGRAPFQLPPMEEVPIDGWIGFNGSYIWDRHGVLFEDPLPTEDVLKVIENAKEMGLPAFLASVERYGANFFQQALEEYMAFSQHHCDVLPPEEYDRLSRGRVYQLMVGTRPEQDELLVRGARGARAVRWWEQAVDVVPARCSKAHGMAQVLEKLGLDREQSIAFGDGGNDLDMLAFAGLGVAMGNAEARVQAAADYVAPPCWEDGVAQALERLGLTAP